ncbi:MAG: hypothetical protein WAV56_01560 [Microgenomates group bacterium]
MDIFDRFGDFVGNLDIGTSDLGGQAFLVVTVIVSLIGWIPILIFFQWMTSVYGYQIGTTISIVVCGGAALLFCVPSALLTWKKYFKKDEQRDESDN